MTRLMAHTNIRTTSTRGNWSLNSHQCHQHCSSYSRQDITIQLFWSSPPPSPSPPAWSSWRWSWPAGARPPPPWWAPDLTHRESSLHLSRHILLTEQEGQRVSGPVELEVGVVVEADGLLEVEGVLASGRVHHFQAWMRIEVIKNWKCSRRVQWLAGLEIVPWRIFSAVLGLEC